ncbi:MULTISPECIES: aerolysin family beta-barrel pore-forming toxin [Photobacterium]|uniref:Aerolysin-like C-terminal domain-containing protein n=2 Tax=Photobacterium TaxID=657 RepID=Q6LFZ2_PHOPR|nr:MULTISPECIES: aerolysin family beta-barrel pore-forming toxin [Photobacterium]PSU48825.1 aerolysin family beta-barrel pore-forming toxin [Photobacterium frigidiphilum]CAG23788.1 hypothetical protein PBPRB1941 [Photobacterium profundum SS9]
MKKLSMLALSIMGAFAYPNIASAQITIYDLDIQGQTCNSEYRPITRSEARFLGTALTNKMGEWQITNLADGYVIMGSGYGYEIKQDGLWHTTFCVPTKIEIPQIYDMSPINIPENDVLTVEWDLINQVEFYQPWARLANALGFAWAGGTRSKYAGEDMVVTRQSDHDFLVTGYNNGNCNGYRCDERLKMEFTNFNYEVEPSTLWVGKKVESDKESYGYIVGYAKNASSTMQQRRLTYSYSESTNWSKTDTYKYSEKVTSKSKFKFPLIGETELSLELGAEQSFATTDGKSSQKTISDVAVVNVPPHTQIPVFLKIEKATVDYPYKFNAQVSYDVTLTSFMRWGGNALLSHDENRPTKSITYTVGRGSTPATNLLYQYQHPHTPLGTDFWDWSWLVDKHGKDALKWAVSDALRPIKTKVSGDFHADSSYVADVTYLADEPFYGNDERAGRVRRSVGSAPIATKEELEQLGIKDFQLNIEPVEDIISQTTSM